MPTQPKQKQLWIGLVEVRALDSSSLILGDTKGAFTNIVTWASSVEEYEGNARLIIGELGGMYVSEFIDPEPLERRRTKRGGTPRKRDRGNGRKGRTKPKCHNLRYFSYVRKR